MLAGLDLIIISEVARVCLVGHVKVWSWNKTTRLSKTTTSDAHVKATFYKSINLTRSVNRHVR